MHVNTVSLSSCLFQFWKEDTVSFEKLINSLHPKCSLPFRSPLAERLLYSPPLRLWEGSPFSISCLYPTTLVHQVSAGLGISFPTETRCGSFLIHSVWGCGPAAVYSSFGSLDSGSSQESVCWHRWSFCGFTISLRTVNSSSNSSTGAPCVLWESFLCLPVGICICLSQGLSRAS